VAPATKEIWVYDLRSQRNFSIRQNPITNEDMTDFVQSYCADDRKRRKETIHFRRFKYADVISRDKANLDMQWKEEQLNSMNGETPRTLMKAIVKDLKEALREFSAVESEIGSK
jgi:type I restriction enzyme M protein